MCGGGETGLPLAEELVTSKAKVVLIEQDNDVIERSRQTKGLYHVHGDATDDKNLVAPSIDRASGITICLPSDNDNLYITMTARMLNTKARIISRMTNRRLKPKLLKAGEELGVPDLYDKIADETVGITEEEILPWLEEKGHPAMSMDPLIG